MAKKKIVKTQPKTTVVEEQVVAPKAEEVKTEPAVVNEEKKAPAKKRACKKTVKAEPAPVLEEKKEAEVSVQKPVKKTAKKTVKKTEAPVQKSKRHILYVASEAFPFAGTGGLGEVIGSLPAAINASEDNEARVILPLYQSITEEDRKTLKYITHIFVPVAWRSQYCGLFVTERNGVTYYFVDNEYYFRRSGLYGYGDDGERYAFFSRAVLELLPMLDWKVDVLHCHDWQSALTPIYYKLYYMNREGYQDIRTVFTIHNIEYQGQYNPAILEDVFGISYGQYMSIEHHGCINLMKGAIDYSDAVTTVSPTYAQQIKTAEYAHGLEDVLNKNSYKLRGILNGIDLNVYNPATNKALFVNYDAESTEKKAENKEGLQNMLSLPVNRNIPMIAMITRLASHKGIDLVRQSIDSILKNDVQFVILGTGEPDHENYFRHLQNIYDSKVRSIVTFNKDMAQKIYASADIFLMPSKSEPCGLSQMMACRYGTIPVVRETGGLKDSIVDCNDGTIGNGFVFARYAADDLLNAVNRATGLYRDYHDLWLGLVDRAAHSDFSWNSSAKQYIDFYNEIDA